MVGLVAACSRPRSSTHPADVYDTHGPDPDRPERRADRAYGLPAQHGGCFGDCHRTAAPGDPYPWQGVQREPARLYQRCPRRPGCAGGLFGAV
jgi:hypothetical protein